MANREDVEDTFSHGLIHTPEVGILINILNVT